MHWFWPNGFCPNGLRPNDAGPSKHILLTDDGGPEVSDVHLLGDVGRREVDDDPLTRLRTFQVFRRRRTDAEVEQVHHLEVDQCFAIWESGSFVLSSTIFNGPLPLRNDSIEQENEL